MMESWEGAFSLEDVREHALSEWRPQAEYGYAVFGAAGRRRSDPELLHLLLSSGAPFESTLHDPDPMARMFSTESGRLAATAVGNETRTLAAMQRLSLEVLAGAMRIKGAADERDRILVMASTSYGQPPLLMLLSPDVISPDESRIISDDLEIPVGAIDDALLELRKDEEFRYAKDTRENPEAIALAALFESGRSSLAELFYVAQPEIVLTRRPRMIPLCAPWPHLVVDAAGSISTAGILCRDSSGVLGVTACWHGTGAVGTYVTVGGRRSRIKHASQVQDTVFIPLDGFSTPPLKARGGVRMDREPATADVGHFDGATNPNSKTRILSADAGLLRARPSVQLRIQTGPDTDRGDSGCALIDEDDRVLGFAFERTALDDFPQFTDWIWAANALRTLNLTAF